MAALPAESTLLLDPRRMTYGLHQAIAPGVRIIEAFNPTTFTKSRKLEAEAGFVRQAMEQDGAALCEFFTWLEAALARADVITELDLDLDDPSGDARLDTPTSPGTRAPLPQEAPGPSLTALVAPTAEPAVVTPRGVAIARGVPVLFHPALAPSPAITPTAPFRTTTPLLRRMPLSAAMVCCSSIQAANTSAVRPTSPVWCLLVSCTQNISAISHWS